MEHHSTVQKQITAGGHVAGGHLDIDNSITINRLASGKAPLAMLIEKYNNEVASGATVESLIEKLQHWTSPDPSTPVLGVKEKLQKGNRSDLVDFGLRAKELFSKCLARHQHSRAAQEMCVYLLAAVWQKFNSVIRPRILENVPHFEIDILVQSELVGPIEEMLDSNPLQIDQSEIMGMIYFLTGNCHLNWH